MCSQPFGITGKIKRLRAFLASLSPEKLIVSGVLDELLQGAMPARVLCVGKAGRALARGAAARFKGVEGFLFETSDGAPGPAPLNFVHRMGEHPVAGPLSLDGTRSLYEWLMEGEGPLLALVSGGSSSLCCDPPPGWTLKEVAAVETALLESGAPIRDINAVRLRLSRARGGGLRLRAGAWPLFTGVWCDVAPPQWRLTGSAPTFWPRGIPRAERVAERLSLDLPRSLPPLFRVSCSRFDRSACLADSARMVDEAVSFIEEEGMEARPLLAPEAIAPRALARRFKAEALKTAKRPAAIIGAGEAPVRVTAKGRGGRCSHLACEVALALEGVSGWTFVAMATDGVDGAAGSGAVVSDMTAPPREMLKEALAACATGELLDAHSCLLPRDPSGNNLRDLWVLFLE